MSALVKHPIQLLQIQIHELSFKVNKQCSDVLSADEPEFSIGFGHTIEEDGKIVAVGVKAKTKNAKKSKYSITVEVVGIFSVGKPFDKAIVPDWVSKNAPFILLPYLREHIYALSLRAGVSPFYLPLIQIPSTAL